MSDEPSAKTGQKPQETGLFCKCSGSKGCGKPPSGEMIVAALQSDCDWDGKLPHDPSKVYIFCFQGNAGKEDYPGVFRSSECYGIWRVGKKVQITCMPIERLRKLYQV